MRWTFTVPGEPKGKGRPRFSRASGRPYTPKGTEIYEARVAMEFRAEYPEVTPTEKPIELWLSANFGIPKSWPKRKRASAPGLPCMKKPDADNILKAVCDGLNGIAYKDDAQITEVHLMKAYGEVPFVRVTIVEAEEEE